MKKGYIFGLVALFGFSNTAYAAITSLSTTGAWQTATGDLSGIFGQSAPATWTYDTDLSVVPQLALDAPLPSGGTISAYHFVAPTYSLSGTAAPSIFDGTSFVVNILDNGIATHDGGSTELINSMTNAGLDPSSVGDVLLFSARTEFDNGNSYDLFGLMHFSEDFFSGSIMSLPPAEILLEQALFTYAALSHSVDFGGGFVETGFANYAQSPSAVPVPAAAFLFAPALLGFLGLHRKTKNTVI